jgi:hypothetical protein
MRTRGIPPLAKPEISRFPRKELPHMPGSWTTPGRAGARAIASVRVAFRAFEHVGTQVAQVFAAQWLAYVLPYRRFADTLASAHARLRAGADRYSFTVGDFHLLLLAGLPGAPKVLNNDNSTEGSTAAGRLAQRYLEQDQHTAAGRKALLSTFRPWRTVRKPHKMISAATKAGAPVNWIAKSAARAVTDQVET